ncbi:unnamed protein product [Euphydryas editha]|uniref:G-protein coupled receptors family 2 profile 2 domain-containing protein n=1 Tax=Euphydryas editha TaxID=104508 RepID=A0AAU9UDY1_EUPED|nr:unnamed protein product [Euphydryas editha]
MWKLLSLLIIVSNSASQNISCDKNNTVDLTSGNRSSNGDIYYGDHKYERSEYTIHNGTITSCICLKEICIKKCCPHGMGFHLKNKVCEEVAEPFNVPFVDKNSEFKVTIRVQSHNILCHIKENRIRLNQLYTNRNEIRPDGQLYIEVQFTTRSWILRGPDKYCVDRFIFEDDKNNRTTSYDAFVCFESENEEEHYIMKSTCMIISCVFILATVAVYGWLPELRNLHGRVLMAYLLCLFVGFVGMATMQIMLKIDNIGRETCVGLSIMIYFSLLAGFFWLNVMCFDIWWTFSGKKGVKGAEIMSVKAQFTAYSVYAFGFPTVLTILMVSLEFSGLPPHPLLPLLRHQGCFLTDKSKLLYLYGPIVILWFANVMFFVLTAVKIAQIKRQSSLLKHKESARHDKHKNDQQRFFLYIKLFIVMGINWLLEVISALYPKGDYIWRFVDSYNVLIGLIVFIIFVCKRKIFSLMKKRYALRRGDQLSKSKASTRTSSTRDEMALSTKN